MAHYFDTHCHLTLAQLPLAEHIQLARAAAFKHIFDPGLQVQDCATRLAKLRPYPEILLGAAIAPHSDFQSSTLPAELEQLAGYLATGQFAAIGEIGLEYNHIHDSAHHQLQKHLLREQLQLAKTYKLPVVLHLRNSAARHSTNAYTDAAAIIKSVKPQVPLIAHCFTGSWSDAQTMLACDAFIALGGIVTFKNAVALQDVARKLPLTRLLVETDAPYLAPVPMRGKPNIAPYLIHTQNFLSALLQQESEPFAAQLFNNAQIAFKLIA